MLDNPMVTGQAFTQCDNSKTPKVVARCRRCGEKLYEGYEATEFEGDYFCDTYCFAEYMGLRDVDL